MRIINADDIIAYEGEISSRTIYLEVEPEYDEYLVRLDIELPNGDKYQTEPLQDRTKYEIEEALMVNKGCMKVQIVVYDEPETFMKKSYVRIFKIIRSINAGRSLADIYKLQGKIVETNGDVTITPDPGYYGLSEVQIKILGVIKTDFVLTYEDLETYRTDDLPNGSNIVVLKDVNYDNKVVIYKYDLEENKFNMFSILGEDLYNTIISISSDVDNIKDDIKALADDVKEIIEQDSVTQEEYDDIVKAIYGGGNSE